MKRSQFLNLALLLPVAAEAYGAKAPVVPKGEDTISVRMWWSPPVLLGDQALFEKFVPFFKDAFIEFDTRIQTAKIDGIAQRGKSDTGFTSIYRTQGYDVFKETLKWKDLNNALSEPHDMQGPYAVEFLLATWRLWNGSIEPAQCKILQVCAVWRKDDENCACVVYRRGAHVGK